MFKRINFVVKEKKTDILILKVMIKSLFCCFCTKTQYFFILNYRGVGQERDEGGLSK